MDTPSYLELYIIDVIYCFPGEISDEFDLTVGSPVNSAAFHKASYNQGYDLYLTSVEAPVLFSISLLNGKIDVIRGKYILQSLSVYIWFSPASILYKSIAGR